MFAVALAVVAPAMVTLLGGADTADEGLVKLVSLTLVAGYSSIAALACLGALAASRKGIGLEARMWRLLGLGLLSWTFGGVAYVVFLSLGGGPDEPSAWSQAGYLLAYPFWYRALWLLRQPVLASSRLSRLETIGVEFSALVLFGVVIASVLWHPPLPITQNIAQLVPAMLDLLLLVAFYGAVRRSPMGTTTALPLLGYAFAGLAVTDQIVTYLVTREHLLGALAASMGYVAVMAVMMLAAHRPMRVAHAQRSAAPLASYVAVIGLGLVGVATVVAPAGFRWAIWIVGAFLAWRLIVQVGARESSDIDLVTGLLEPRAFERHLGGVLQHASGERPSLLIAIDLVEFGPWNARNGYTAGDALLARTAKAIEGRGPADAVWGRIGQDQFAITAIASDERDNRALAERLRSEAVHGAGELEARAGIVVLPVDASSAQEALEGAREALTAAQEADRKVVAYTQGELDGLTATPGSASRANRRTRIQEIIAANEAIVPFVQPIVGLDDLRIRGFEALSRFQVEPKRGPDQWIAEATQLGLGVDLEMECLTRAITRLYDAPPGVYLSINASPDTLLSDEMVDFMESNALDRFVIEVTEHERVKNYPRLAARLAALRGRGAKIAIDDTGAGHSSLSHLIELRPDYIKLDRSLVQGLDSDSGKHALVRNMLRLADDLGAKMVAEGIETERELAVLKDLGVPFGQGYHLGRPSKEIDDHVEQLGVHSALHHEIAETPPRAAAKSPEATS